MNGEQRTSRLTESRTASISAVVGVVFAIGGIVATYLANQRIMGALFNADAIQMPAVFADIFEHGGSISDWNIAPAPAIVPEYGMYAIAYVLGGTMYWRILIYSIMQVLLLGALVFGLGKVIGVRNPLVAASVTVSLMSLFALLHVQNFPQLVQSAFHFGGFLLQILMFALVVILWRTTDRRRALVMLGLVALLTVVAALNDALFVVQMVVPLVLVTLVAVALRRLDWRRGILFVAVIGASAFLGFKLYPRLIPHPTTTISRFDPTGLGTDASELGTTISDDYVSTPILAVLALVTLALGVLAAVELVRRRRVVRIPVFTDDSLRVLAVVALLASLTSIVAVLLTSAIVTPRYLLPMDYWPCILVPMLVVELRWKWMPLVAAAMAIVFGLGSTGIGLSEVSKNGLHADYYPTWQSCVDKVVEKYGIRHALGTYWVSKPVQELSRTDLTVTTESDIRGQQFWVASTKNQYATYDAFIDQNKNPTNEILEKLIDVAGKPIKTVKCRRVSITIWEPGSIAASDLIEK